MYTDFLSKIGKYIKHDGFAIDMYKAVDAAFSELSAAIEELKNNFFFDTMTEKAVLFMETFLKITPTAAQTLENRRDAIRAKWRSKGHNNITLIQNVCNAWKKGEVIADFVNGKIRLTFVGEYGVPEDFNALTDAVNVIKPAHLPYEILFRYLLKKNIHLVLTKSQMQEYQKHKYCKGTV